jgi:transcriptional regulator with XRE-family HTH domain
MKTFRASWVHGAGPGGWEVIESLPSTAQPKLRAATCDMREKKVAHGSPLIDGTDGTLARVLRVVGLQVSATAYRQVSPSCGKRGSVVGDSASPLLQRRRLRTELKTARLNKELTQEQVAKAMDWSLSKMNRIEKAKTGISTNDLKALLPLYGITDKRTDELLNLARAARRPGWWRQYSDLAPATLLELMDYESAASFVHQFESTLIPGILQTEDYASAILQEFYGRNMPEENIRKLVKLRTRRRDLLGDVDAPRFSFVLDESAVHRQVGSPDVTSKQLRQLVSIADLPNVTIQIVPFTAGLHRGVGGAFEVVEFDDTDDENIVFIEGPRGDFISDDPGEAGRYLKDFQLIRDKSLTPADSVALLRKAAAEMG